jgi:NAD(P)-dependent dehydrogenase (short-subunit alcohol dehydrogenase family)
VLLTGGTFTGPELHGKLSSYAGVGALHPVGRVGEIEDVVGGVLYLESASFVTGEVLHIDGCQSAGH